MNKKAEKITITPSDGNVFADLEIFESEKYLAKAELALQLNRIIEQRKLKQTEAAEILEIDQPKISALRCGRLDDFSLERLIMFLNKLDRDVEIIVRSKPTRRKAHGQLRVALI